MEKNTDRHGQAQTEEEGLIPKHGGYRKLKTFQLAEVIYDVTVRFCEKYVDPRSRTRDQMAQAARSGRQNIAEGSVDSATSKKIELKLTGVAKGSLEELRLDYEDYLRQRGQPRWQSGHPALVRFRARRCACLEDFRQWVGEEVKRAKKETDPHGQTRTVERNKNAHVRTHTGDGDAGRRDVRENPCPSVFVANGALSLLNLCIYLLDRQLKAQAEAFEKEGGFTERLYRKRKEARGRKKRNNGNGNAKRLATRVLFLRHVIRSPHEGWCCGIVLDEGLLFRTSRDAFKDQAETAR